MNKRAFTACQIKDLSAPALALRRNGGWERLRLDGFAPANPSALLLSNLFHKFVRSLHSQRRYRNASGRLSARPSHRLTPSSTPSVGLLSQSQVWLSSSFAFTLAEVLITLAVIGVVAALTIPAVVQNYQKTQAVTQLKKVYSALSNTTNLAIAAEGPVSGWELGANSSGQAASDFADKYLIPYLKVAKNCGTKTTDDCAYIYKNKANTKTVLDNQYLRFYLNDGTFIALSVENNPGVPALTVTTAVDINGQKPPNLLGRDVFSYRYILLHRDYPNETGKLIPNCFGNFSRNGLLNNTTYGCNVTGSCCTAVIMLDGWKISDDYLW